MARIYFNERQHAAVLNAIRLMLRKRQRTLAETYVFIYEFYRENGYMPTQDEIGAKFWISGSGAWKRICRLERNGHIKTKFDKRRAWKIVALEGVPNA